MVIGIRLPCSPLWWLLVLLAASPSAFADTSDANTADPAPDEISYFGESVSSLNQWPRSSAWAISYRKIVTDYFATSLAYLNDGHFPGHHRDGITGEVWLPINFFSQHVTISVGGGPFYYYDTVAAANSNSYADNHGWAWITSVDATWQFRGDRTGPFLELRLDHTAPAKSIETTSIGLGLGYRGFSDIHDKANSDAKDGFAPNELAAYYYKTVVNSFSSQTAPAEEIEYRRQIWNELRGSVGFLNEGDAQLIRRNGFLAEVWAEPSFNSGLWSIGVGFGGYSAIDKYRSEPGRHVSDVVSATVSVRPLKNFDIRFLWHRIVTDYSRDTDVVLWGLGYRFK
jgi:uncharacterized protein YhjY with autotransporter beta-barrel domain